jgi:hypothetical protein
MNCNCVESLVIPEAKLTQYLLVFQEKDDKSKFLAQASFTAANPEALRQAIIDLVTENDAILNRTTKYGTFYRVEGKLVGVTRRTLLVVTVWLERMQDGNIQFVTILGWVTCPTSSPHPVSVTFRSILSAHQPE